MSDSFQNSVINTFPTIFEVVFKPIQKSYLKVILLNITFVFLLTLGLVFFLDSNELFEVSEFSFAIYIIITALFAVIFFLKIISFKTRKYIVREKDLSYKSGLLFKKLTTVPFNRIQHVEIDQGPFTRMFHLVSLSVFTAGDSSDDLKIRGLLKEEADQINDFISSQIDG
ncbi:PH domain-containing protein [Polaribacter sp. HL-MS24]|uniref:PH domain-containing protein n=1 Tax=Polaribacter sp. HL-MS24 TaxID=3077735 RepID=UPI002934B3AF|nr:PH domain-containing protein [Polaribacter sp. HL-MS24]WOC39834.1 PH domain-containing protein [Polaribacter sp. HL-MS24]